MLLAPTLVGCTLAGWHRGQIDQSAQRILQDKQEALYGESQEFMIRQPADTLRTRLLVGQSLPRASDASLGTRFVDPIDQWPDPEYLEIDPNASAELAEAAADPITLGLTDALRVAASNSRNYQRAKEDVFIAALEYDLELDVFRDTWSAVITSLLTSELQVPIVLDEERGIIDPQTVRSSETTGVLGFSQRFRNGIDLATSIRLDLVSLLTQEHRFSKGIFADMTITVPLLRGSGEFIVTEPLTQAERNVMYALYDFERFKRTFAVDVASDYFSVLQQLDQIENNEQNYRNLVATTRRTVALANRGRLPPVQVDQARQDELQARNRWIAAQQSYRRQLDGFKLTLGLPTDAQVELDPNELELIAGVFAPLMRVPESVDEDLTEVLPADAEVNLMPPDRELIGPLEFEPAFAVELAFEHRTDLQVALGRVYDAQRDVAVAADQLRPELTLLGSAEAGATRSLASVELADAALRLDEGVYSALLTIDLPIERKAEQVVYRSALIAFEQAVREGQRVEDQIKLDVRSRLSELLEARESFRIQAVAVQLAQRRVTSTNLLLQLGRAEIRDVLEAQEDLLSAQNGLTGGLVQYRLGELRLQRDMGVLEVSNTGLWRELPEEMRGAATSASPEPQSNNI